MKMKVFRNLAVLSLSAIAMFACGGSEHSVSSIEFVQPVRQIMAFDDNPLEVDLVVNDGPNQRIVIPGGQAAASVGITGIIPGQLNTIKISWIEILNGFPIFLSYQEMEFFGTGNIFIDADHLTNVYDFDNDGSSNLEERNAGSCVWDADNLCRTDGGSDVPPNVAEQLAAGPNDVFMVGGFSESGIVVQDSRIDDGIETVREFQFNTGAQGWVSEDDLGARVTNNALCVPWKNGPSGVQEVVMYLDSVVPYVQGQTYVVQYDLRVLERLAPVTLGATDSQETGYVMIVDHYVQGTTEWQTHTIEFVSNRSTPNGTLGFLAMRNAMPTTYCFDNIKLVKT